MEREREEGGSRGRQEHRRREIRVEQEGRTGGATDRRSGAGEDQRNGGWEKA